MAEIFQTATLSDEIVHLNPVIARNEATKQPSGLFSGLLHCVRNDDPLDVRNDDSLDNRSNDLLKKQLTEQSTALSALLQTIPQTISNHRLQLQDDIADIVLTIVQQFFIHQQHNKESIELQINQIIKQLNEKQHIVLSLHPHDLSLLQQEPMSLDLKQYQQLHIVPDDSLRLGGCVVRSEHGVFDASIERQIDNLKQALLTMKLGENHE